MRIAIDGRWIFAQTSGIGRYARELIRQLTALPTPHEWVVLVSEAEVAERLIEILRETRNPRARVEHRPWTLFSPSSQWRTPRWLRQTAPDVYHSPNWLIPYGAFGPRQPSRPACVVTVHDLIPICFPQFTPRARKNRLRPVFRLLFRWTLRCADRIIVPSETTRRDLLREFGGMLRRADPIRVIPEAADARFRPGPDWRRPPPTVLFVGRRDPYKNLPLLIEAFAQLHREAPETRLEVIGPPDPRYPEPEETARRLGLGEAIVWRGHLGFDEVVSAYQRAWVLALPSRYEGFGLPVLEAMACGTPVVCSDTPALVEVAGGAALHVPADDAGALAEAIRRVLRDEGLAKRLRARGLERAARFSWRATAEATLQVYLEAAEHRSARASGD